MNHPTLTIATDAEDLAERAAERLLQAAGKRSARAGALPRRWPAARRRRSFTPCWRSRGMPPGSIGSCALFLGDERFAPIDDLRSNSALIRWTLLAAATVPAERVYPVPVHRASVDEAPPAYEESLGAAFGVPDRRLPLRFDLVLLGLGDDGHTASLFPHAPSLAVTDRWVVGSPPGTLPPPVDRITLTFLVLNAARRVRFLVSGEKKAGVLQELLEGQPRLEVRPAAGVRRVDETVEWLVDEAAASALTRRSH